MENTDLDLLDPHPNIHALFMHYVATYFENSPSMGGVSVEWSSARMTSCGGTCQRVPGGAVIKLSQPLLSLRPAKDLKMVLLHEMIHAYCMTNNLRDDDPSGHGTSFKSHMRRINMSTVFDPERPPDGYNINIYHTMLAEVDYYRQHHWKCERCGNIVKRAMNRKPQEADCRGRAGDKCRDPNCKWHMHLRHCGGEFIKIKEPEGYNQKKSRKKDGTQQLQELKRPKKPEGRPITDFFKTGGTSSSAIIEQEDNTQNSSSLHPGIVAILQHNSHTASASAQEPSAEERRRLIAEAALRRAQVNASDVSELHTQPKLSAHTDNDDHDEDAGKSSENPSIITILDDSDDNDNDDDNDSGWELPVVATSQPDDEVKGIIRCPLCSRCWAAGEISNDVLNQHIDQCLTGQP